MKLKIVILAGILLLVGAGAGMAQSATEPFDVRISIRQAIVIAEDRDLNFGQIEATGAIQNLSISADNAGTGTSGVGSQSAQFTLTGDPGYPVTVSVLSPAGGCDPAGELTFSLQESTGGVATALASGAPGTQVWVGGTVAVPANPTPQTLAAGTTTCVGTLQVVYN